MKLALSILLVITSVLMILLVLLHKGKGSGLSDLFGGGISTNYGGSSVVERNLDRITIVVGGLRYLVRGWLWTLTPNGGSSLADRLARIETRQEQMMELLKK